MRLLNTTNNYGIFSILLHWLTAGLVFFLFASGLYMTSLDYYDPGYHYWPTWHKQLGVVLVVAFVLRLLLKWVQSKPAPLLSHSDWEVKLAKLTHVLIYFLLATILLTGYLIATSKGEGVSFFGWFEVPAVWAIGKNADWVGKIHLYVAIALIGLVVLHILGAIKHSVIDKDKTLGRMFGK